MKHRDELEKLAEGLLTIKEKDFDMGCWREGTTPNIETATCGFAGCAIGWLPTLVPTCGITFKSVRAPGGGKHIYPVYEVFSYFYAIAVYFDIPVKDAEYLFTPGEYREGYDEEEESYEDIPPITPQEVSERIKAYVEAYYFRDSISPSDDNKKLS